MTRINPVLKMIIAKGLKPDLTKRKTGKIRPLMTAKIKTDTKTHTKRKE